MDCSPAPSTVVFVSPLVHTALCVLVFACRALPQEARCSLHHGFGSSQSVVVLMEMSVYLTVARVCLKVTVDTSCSTAVGCTVSYVSLSKSFLLTQVGRVPVTDTLQRRRPTVLIQISDGVVLDVNRVLFTDHGKVS